MRRIDFIVWHDAAQWDDDHGPEVFEGDESYVIESVGFVTFEDGDRVFLTRDIGESGSSPYRRTVEIPKGMIVRREQLTTKAP
jgi:hypothetical protein